MFVVPFASSIAQIENPWVGAYYVSYSRIRPAAIDWSGITHVYHLGAGVETGFVANGPTYWQLTNSPADSVLFFSNDGNFHGANIVQELISTVHSKSGKVLLSTGTPFGTNRNAFMIDSTILQVAVNNIAAFAKRWGYDGIDVDWESLDKTKTLISQLTRMLRTALDTWNPAGILTFSFGHVDCEYYDPTFQSIVQQYNIFGYDLKQNNDNVTSFNSPLYAPQSSLSLSLNNWQDNWFGTWGKFPGVIQNGVRKMMSKGFDSRKLGIGIPTYGYLWTNKNGPGQPRSGSIIDAGYCRYEEAIATLSKGGMYHWVDTSKVPWIGGTATSNISSAIPSGTEFYITFDDTNSVKWKVAWAKQYKLGGIMIYDVELGILTGRPKGSNLPLINAIVKEVTHLYNIRSNLKPSQKNTRSNLKTPPKNTRSNLKTSQNITRSNSKTTQNVVPIEYTLEQNYPNPLGPGIIISFSIPRCAHVSLKVFNSRGQSVALLVDTNLEPGHHSVSFNPSSYDSSSGEYYYRIETPDYSETKKLLLK